MVGNPLRLQALVCKLYVSLAVVMTNELYRLHINLSCGDESVNNLCKWFAFVVCDEIAPTPPPCTQAVAFHSPPTRSLKINSFISLFRADGFPREALDKTKVRLGAVNPFEPEGLLPVVVGPQVNPQNAAPYLFVALGATVP